MKKVNINRCLHCGSDNVIMFEYDSYNEYKGDYTKYVVRCEDCKVNVEAETQELALAVWNNTEGIQLLLEELLTNL